MVTITKGKGKQRIFEEKMARRHGLPDIYSIRDKVKEDRLELIVSLKVLGYSNAAISKEVLLDRRRVDRIIREMVQKGVLTHEQAEAKTILAERSDEEKRKRRERNRALRLENKRPY